VQPAALDGSGDDGAAPAASSESKNRQFFLPEALNLIRAPRRARLFLSEVLVSRRPALPTFITVFLPRYDPRRQQPDEPHRHGRAAEGLRFLLIDPAVGGSSARKPVDRSAESR